MKIQTIHTKNLRWIDITDPGVEEIAWLKARFKFAALHYEAAAQHQQRPRFDQGEGYDFMVLLFPVYDRAAGEIIPGEVDFFSGPRFVITIHYGQIHNLKMLFNEARTSAESRSAIMQKGSGFLLYKILEKLLRRSYPILDHMNEDISRIEKQIFHDGGTDLLSRISLMKKNIIEFRKMMKTHRYVLEKLPRQDSSYLLFPQFKLYYRDLLEYFENIWDILEALKETADSLAETNQALTAHHTREITKAVSIFSAVVLPATLVAFVFGIAVEDLPLRHHPHAFWIILGLMAISSLVMYAVFKHKKWF